jgi:hypothetical protein
MTKDLSGKIVEIAQARQRLGYQRIHELLHPEFPGMNHKHVYQLYSEANLAVRRRKKVRRPVPSRSACRCRLARASMRCGAWTSSATAWPMVGASSACRWPMTSAMSVWTSLWTEASWASSYPAARSRRHLPRLPAGRAQRQWPPNLPAGHSWLGRTITAPNTS